MNYKLIALGILIISPILAMLASHVPDMIPTKQVQGSAAPAAQPANVAAAPTPAPMPIVSGPPPVLGEANPLVGQPMIDTDAQLSGPPTPAPAPIPAATPSGILPPYPGQDRAPAQGTVYLPDGKKVG